MTLLAAGHETTATALAWALERLARHPEARARAASDDAYLDAVVKEVLRTRPVLSITARKTLQPYEVGGYTLPAGVYVAPCLYLAHRRPELWHGADRVPARALPRAARRSRTRSSRSAAARAAASAPRSRRWRCARCSGRCRSGSRSHPTAPEGERMRRRSDHPRARARVGTSCRAASVIRRACRHVLSP